MFKSVKSLKLSNREFLKLSNVESYGLIFLTRCRLDICETPIARSNATKYDKYYVVKETHVSRTVETVASVGQAIYSRNRL